MQPKTAEFYDILAANPQPTSANLMQLLVAAGDYLEAGEMLCEAGCLAGANLIAFLRSHPDRLAYGVDFFSDHPQLAASMVDELEGYFAAFDVSDRISFTHHSPTEFFQELREFDSEDRFGIYFCNLQPGYRNTLVSLLLASNFLAPQALIVVNNTNHAQTRDAIADFMKVHPVAKLVLDWQTTGNCAFGAQGLTLLAWDRSDRMGAIAPSIVQEQHVVSAVTPAPLPNTPVRRYATKKVLHVGCGMYDPEALPPELRAEAWQEIRLDINPAVYPDILGSITDLSSVRDASVDAVYSSANLEHVYTHEVPLALREFRRVLNPNGFAIITVPDIQAVAEHLVQGQLETPLYLSPAGPITAMDILYGFGPDLAKGNDYMAHKTAFTAATLRQKLLDAGFSEVEIQHKGLTLRATAYVGSKAMACT